MANSPVDTIQIDYQKLNIGTVFVLYVRCLVECLGMLYYYKCKNHIFAPL